MTKQSRQKWVLVTLYSDFLVKFLDFAILISQASKKRNFSIIEPVNKQYLEPNHCALNLQFSASSAGLLIFLIFVSGAS